MLFRLTPKDERSRKDLEEMLRKIDILNYNYFYLSFPYPNTILKCLNL